MDSASLSSIASADVSSRISMAVSRKALDTARQEGDAMIALLRNVAQIGQGASTGAVARPERAETGDGLDLYA